jgi:NitT/TauT family transport system substrate-binding protein
VPRSPRCLALAVVALGVLAACGDSAGSPATEDVTLRLGYFPNITHAPAIIGVDQRLFADSLGDDVVLEPTTFNAGPEAVEALFAGEVDITYIGPNPAISAWQRSGGEAIHIIAGSTSGGAFLVVKPEVTSVDDLEGRTLATPQLGNTQDVALRSWLKQNGYETDVSGGGDVKIQPQANADTLTQFVDGSIDGAWVPEPWATRLIEEGGGRVLVDEADLWDGGDFVTAHVVVRSEFLDEHPDVVKQFLEGHVAAIEFANANETEAQTIVNDGIGKLTTKRLGDAIITGAWKNLRFTDDPIAGSLEESARDAEDVGLLDPVDLDGIYALELLNEVRDAAGSAAVKGI